MQSVREVMTQDPVCLDAGAPVLEAARKMREEHIGNVVVTKDGRAYGILTDRDIVVRCLAERADASKCNCGEVCSADIVTVAPTDSVEHAIALMREHAVRRLIATEDERPVGIVSLGDLAQQLDRYSALGEISAASPNH
jgi:CBS domain-containing protein